MKLHRIGDIIRYDYGTTALMRIESVNPGHGGSIARYWGTHCGGGTVGVYHEKIRPIEDGDKDTWDRYKKWRDE